MAGTIQQIAELTGVSRGTVDRALHHRGRVDPEVAQRIEQVAEELGYLTRTQKKTDDTWAVPAKYKKTIGVITQLSGSSFMISVRQGLTDIQKKLARQGIEVIIREGEGVDETEQLRLLDEIEDRIDALAIMPVDSDRIRERLVRLHEVNKPVITFNTDITGGGRMAFVGLDNRRAGEAAAGLLSQLMSSTGKVLGIVGNFSNQAGMQRVDGFSEALRRDFPGMELVGIQPSFDRSGEVEQIIRGALQTWPDLGGILVISGGQEGVRQALTDQNPENRPCVILYDRTPRNARLLEDGFADFVIDQDGYTQGYRSVSMLADYLRWGKKPDQEHMFTEINIRTKYTI